MSYIIKSTTQEEDTITTLVEYTLGDTVLEVSIPHFRPSSAQDVGFVTATDMDSSGGVTIWDYKGLLSNTLNWNLFQYPQAVAYTFVS